MLASSKLRHLSHFRWLSALSSKSIKHKNLGIPWESQAGCAALVSREYVRCTSSHRQDGRLSNTYASTRTFHRTAYQCTDEIRTVSAPNFAESVTEGDIKWEKAVGDQVAVDEVVAEIETDKTNMPVHSPAAGVIEELLVKDGETITAGKSLFKLRVGAAAPKKEAEAPKREAEPAASKSESTQQRPPRPTSASGRIPDMAPPPARPPAIPLTSTPASSVKPKPAASSSPSGTAPTGITGSRTEQRVKMNRMRQRIATRLKDAQNTCAMLTTFNEIDMSNVMEMRNLYKDPFLKKYNLKLGFMSAFVKAAAFALADQPVVNAVIDDLDIVYRDFIDISVAVATPKGLVVPVIRNVETMNYADIEKTIADLGERARAGTLAIEDMDGGTFTISNGGVFGSMFGTPIINPPQSAILGMHGIFDRPVAVKGQVQIRPMMYVALTYDHKLVDGREAVTFLRKIKSAVEDPRTILLDL
uniref:Dihydrolipoyllysine-residue succinyltransferase component of 2-oxoglutarate dehydrogenase complex, mitochondrial n=1 Tax=Arion vulgaris TaxID=1028688 RepID=A0A0B7AK64_9EUPU